MGELLKIDHLSYTYHNFEGETPVLNDVSFHVMDGEFVAILGPSGCGKSTLLSLIAGLLSPISGSIYINNMDIKSSGKVIGYMLQKDHLSDWHNSLNNATHGLELQHKLSDNSYVQINELLNSYGLITFENSSLETSDGIKQRAALIRTLFTEADLLLLDEPFSAQDYQLCLETSEDIWGLLRKEKKTVILVTADIKEAIKMADRVIVLSSFPGMVNEVFDINLSFEIRSCSNSLDTSEIHEYFHQIQKKLIQNEFDQPLD